MPICKREQTDQYTDMFASRHENCRKSEPQTDHYTDLFAGRHGDCRQVREDPDRYPPLFATRPKRVENAHLYADMYVSPSDAERPKMAGVSDCDLYTSCHGEHGDIHTDMMSYSGREQTEAVAGRGMTIFGTERDLTDTREMPAYCGEGDVRDSGAETGQGMQGKEKDASKCVEVKCLKCKEKIRQRHLVLLNDGRFLHEHCLRCEVCLLTITLCNNKGSAYLRDNKLYCREDYIQLFSSEPKREMPHCIKCNVQLEKDNWVRRADNYLFHMTCFCCSKCSRQLSRFEQFIMREERVICEKHFFENDGTQKGDSPKPRAKRMRTSFTEEQVKVLQQHFAIDSNPDGQDLERIAKLTGLKKRVTQVWFQNNRARHKKSMQQNSAGQTGTSSMSASFSPNVPASAMYVSASEESDSVHGNDLAVFHGDVDHQEDGTVHTDFTQQNFWSHIDN